MPDGAPGPGGRDGDGDGRLGWNEFQNFCCQTVIHTTAPDVDCFAQIKVGGGRSGGQAAGGEGGAAQRALARKDGNQRRKLNLMTVCRKMACLSKDGVYRLTGLNKS